MTAIAIQLHETEAVVSLGLCGTCTSMPGCGFYTGPNPVIQCEEFTLDETPRLSWSHSRRPPISALNRRAEETILGICANCDESERCTFRTPARVIWQCEEYR